MDTKEDFQQYSLEFEEKLAMIIKDIRTVEDYILAGGRYIPAQPKLEVDLPRLFEGAKYYGVFMNDMVVSNLKNQVGENTNFFKWFIPFNELLREFRQIEQNGILVNKLFAYVLIKDYLVLK